MTVCCSSLTLLLIFIWGNSLLPGHISGAFSDWVKEILANLLPFLFTGSDANAGGGLLRKLAHFTEFAALGTCLSWFYAMLTANHRRQLLFAGLSGILAACIDETIQRFVPQRNGCLTDVGIDTAGVITGIVLLTIAYLINKNKHQSLEEIT